MKAFPQREILHLILNTQYPTDNQIFKAFNSRLKSKMMKRLSKMPNIQNLSVEVLCTGMLSSLDLQPYIFMKWFLVMPIKILLNVLQSFQL